MLIKSLAFAAVFVTVSVVADQVKYDGYHLVRAKVQSRYHGDIIQRLLDQKSANPTVRLLNEMRKGKTADLLLEPKTAPQIIRLLKWQGFQPEIVTDNIQSFFDLERKNQVSTSLFNLHDDPSKFPFDKFNSFDAIINWLKAVEGKYDFVKTFKVGTTTEKRDFFGVKISKASKDDKPKPAFWIDGGIHAREWMSPAVVVYVINELTSKYGSDQEITELVDGIDFLIVPSINPDGYEYSRSDDRLWRKTRSINDNADCPGADENRNYDWHWDSEGGADTEPCSDIYKGKSVFSEPEAKAVGDAIYANNQTLKALITTHTFGNLWLIPFGDGSHPDDYQELEDAAKEAAKATVDAGGPEFTVGNSAEVLYQTTGTTEDFAKGPAGVKYSYTVEIGESFTDPDTEIIKKASTTFAGFKVIAKRVLKQP